MTDSSSPVLSSTSSKKVNSNDGYNGNGEKEWSCTSCTFLNSWAVPLCEMCNAHKPLSLLCWDFKSKESVIDLTTVRNDDGFPKGSENRSNSVDEKYRVSFTKMNSNHTWNVASTESARKRRKRKMSDNGRSANSDGHDTISNPKNMIVINDTDDDENNDVVSKSLRSKKISSLRNNIMETGRFKSRHGDQVQRSSVVQSGHVNGGRIHDDEKHSKLDRSPNESLSSSSLCNKSKLQSTLFGSVLPDTKTKRQTEPSSDNIKKRSSRTASGSKRQDSWSDLEYSDQPINTFKDKKENMPSTETGSFTGRTGTIVANPSFSQARYDALMKQATVKMKSIFGISSLRNLQPTAIESALKGQSQIIIMATGGGKSLCYQLPAVVLPGLTVVVSPLIALMVDQVEQLKKKGVAAELICSSQSQKENQKVMQRLRDAALQQENKQKGGKKVKMESLQTVLPMVKLLYCTPELIQTTRFQDILTSLYRVNMLSLIVIDEAHCMSTWGHDFRPAYRKLSWLRTSFSNIPCMACTATATKKVIEEIKQVLCFQNGDKVHMSTFNRANIHYEVRYKDNMSEEDALQNLVQTIQEQHKTCKKNDNKCSGIVYVHKRQDTMMIASRLQQAGIVAAPYHAGLKDAERKRVQQEWTHGTIQVAIATVAFGMGIDLAHVRYVIHWTLSKSIEGFYQESGRAGRDGLPSLSILYYSRDDASKFAFLIRKNLENKQRSTPDKSSSSRDTMDALDKMIEYCTSTCCRRKYLLRHFGEEIDPKKVCRMTCDYCLHPQKVSDAMMSTTQGTSNISRAIRDVKRHSFGYMSSFYDHSNGSDDEEYNRVDHDILFQEWGYGDEDPGGAVVPPASPIHHYQNNKNDHHKKTSGAHAGFSTAGGTQIYNSGRRRNTTTNNILSKYETMEQKQQQQQQSWSKSQPNTKLPSKKSHDKHKSNLWSKVMNQQEDDIPGKHPQHYRQQQQQQQQQQQTSSYTSHIPIPSHLLPKSPNIQKTNPPKHNPNNNYNSTINTATTPSSSKDFASAADAVKAELEEIRKKRESLLAKFSKK